MARHSLQAAKSEALARDEPFIVAPHEVAKTTAHYRTDPEILLGCIIIIGTLDTASLLRTDIHLHHGIKVTADELNAHAAFQRVWHSPTDQERADVLAWAEKIRNATHRRTRFNRLAWNGPAS